MRWATTIPALLAFTSVVFSVSTARSQFENLARQVPSSVNAIVFVNMEKLMTSPQAIKEKWSANRDTAFSSGVSFLPPDAKQAVLAMQVDLQLWLPLWEAAILELDHEPDADKVVKMTGGKSDVIGGRQAVALPGDAYLIKFGKSTAAFMSPANRQTVARWMREVDARKAVSLTPYLTEAYTFANSLGTPVVLALDLEDAIPAEEIKAQLQDSKDFLAEQKLNIDSASKLLAGIRGVTLGITFNEKPFGKIKVDFRDDVTWSPEVGKAALLRALGNHGAMIDEFVDWKPAVKGKQITLEGNLTSSGIGRISCLFDRPPSLKIQQSPEATSKSNEKLIVPASQAYFKKINDLLDDLKDERKENPRYTMGQVGVWMDRYATKIDKLSVLNVDPELVEFSANVSNALRGAYDAIRGGAARSRIRQVNTGVSYGGYDAYGNSYGNTYRGAQRLQNQDQTRVRTEERVVSSSQARDIVGEIKAATGEMRRKMTQKYKVDF